MDAITPDSTIIRRARLEEILALRHAVLRPGRPLAAARFDGDDEAETRHYGAFEEAEAVCCASLMRRPLDGEPAWQLRGMATRPDRRRRGLGARLLARIEADAAGASPAPPPPNGAGVPPRLWCNARTEAVPFYRSQGWSVISDPFDIPDVGPHVRMVSRSPDRRIGRGD
jgi:GNAT superfamily N-acetyltransferase